MSQIFNKRNPTQEELEQQREVLIEKLRARGIEPEQVPRKMQELHDELSAWQKEIEEQLNSKTG